MASEIRNPQLWQDGRLKIDWVRHHMPLLNGLEEEFRQTLPFKGLKVALSVHLEAKTAYLCEVLAAGGAEMYVTGSNPLSTQDDVAAALVEAGLNVYAWYDATPQEYEEHIRRVLEVGPNIIIDDGGDLVNLMHTEYRDLIPGVIGGCEETTTGILRLIQLNKAKEILAYELTKMVHSEADAEKARETAQALFGSGSNIENMPSTDLSAEDYVDGVVNILDLLVKTKLAPSKGEARRLVMQGGVSVNDEKVVDAKVCYSKDSNADGYIIIKKGKKVFHKVNL